MVAKTKQANINIIDAACFDEQRPLSSGCEERQHTQRTRKKSITHHRTTTTSRAKKANPKRIDENFEGFSYQDEEEHFSLDADGLESRSRRSRGSILSSEFHDEEENYLDEEEESEGNGESE